MKAHIKLCDVLVLHRRAHCFEKIEYNVIMCDEIDMMIVQYSNAHGYETDFCCLMLIKINLHDTLHFALRVFLAFTFYSSYYSFFIPSIVSQQVYQLNESGFLSIVLIHFLSCSNYLSFLVLLFLSASSSFHRCFSSSLSIHNLLPTRFSFKSTLKAKFRNIMCSLSI